MGSIVNDIGSAIGGAVQDVGQLASGPLGQAALGALTGGASELLGPATSILGGLMGGAGGGGGVGGMLGGLPGIASGLLGSLGGMTNNPLQGMGGSGGPFGDISAILNQIMGGLTGGSGSGGIGGFPGLGGGSGGSGGAGGLGGFGGGSGGAGGIGGQSVGGLTPGSALQQAEQEANQSIQLQQELTQLQDACAEISKALSTESSIVSKAMQ